MVRAMTGAEDLYQGLQSDTAAKRNRAFEGLTAEVWLRVRPEKSDDALKVLVEAVRRENQSATTKGKVAGKIKMRG